MRYERDGAGRVRRESCARVKLGDCARARVQQASITTPSQLGCERPPVATVAHLSAASGVEADE